MLKTEESFEFSAIVDCALKPLAFFPSYFPRPCLLLCLCLICSPESALQICFFYITGCFACL